jgi:hypothetical protein
LSVLNLFASENSEIGKLPHNTGWTSMGEEEMREIAKMGYEVVLDFLPNVAQCALQDYGRLNDFMILAAKEFPEISDNYNPD